jgi:hypothetical protein
VVGVGTERLPAWGIDGGRRRLPQRLGVTARRGFCWATHEPRGAIDPRECARGLGLQRERPKEGVLRRRRQCRGGGGGSVARGGEKDGT